MIVRKAKYDDLKHILLIGDRYGAETDWSKLEINLSVFARFLLQRMADTESEIYVCLVDDNYAGYAIINVEYIYSNIGNGAIYHIYVLPEYRKHGGYRALISKCLETFNDWKVGFVHVNIAPGYEQVEKHCKLARNLFAKFGFSKVGEVLRKDLIDE